MHIISKVLIGGLALLGGSATDAASLRDLRISGKEKVFLSSSDYHYTEEKGLTKGIDFEMIRNPYYNETLMTIDDAMRSNSNSRNNAQFGSSIGGNNQWEVPYSEETAKRMLFWAEASYKNPNTELEDCIGNNIDNFEIHSHHKSTHKTELLRHGATALITIDHDIESIVVSFKGSSDLGDWINNLHLDNYFAYKTKCEINSENDKEKYTIPGFIHEGHCIYYQELVENHTLKNEFSKAMEKYPTYNFYATGHSMGGSLALLFATNVYETLGIQANVYTFGGPKVGDNDFAKFVTTKKPFKALYRIVSGHDIVPHLPLSLRVNKKSTIPQHPSTEVWYPEPFDKPSEYIICDGSAFGCSNRVKYFLKWTTKHHGVYFGTEHENLCKF